MPKATLNVNEFDHKDLKTLAGAFVDLRRMSFGQVVERRAMLKMSVTTAKGSKDFKGEMAMASREITMFEFAHCVVDHNLFADEDETIKLNLSNPVEFATLDPRVGQEIEKYITDMNNFEDDELGD